MEAERADNQNHLSKWLLHIFLAMGGTSDGRMAHNNQESIGECG